MSSSSSSSPRGRCSPFPNVDASGPRLEHVAELIRSGKVKNVIVMAGAGISTSAGIPDFRSPETGLYANLAKYDLPYAEAIFDIDYFRERPQAFFTLSKDLYPGHFLPTRTHYFFRLLHEKRLLRRVFTQNIDTLERLAGLPADQIVEAHGSFASSRCIRCGAGVEPDWIRERILRGEVARCEVERCMRQSADGQTGGLVKPDIVFFGESLPKRFFELVGDFKEADLLIVLGTSLKVQPFASLIDRVPSSCPRLLINLELVGEIGGQDGSDDEGAGGMRGGWVSESGFDFKGWATGGRQHARDVAFLGDADEGIKKIAEICGWEDELEKMMEEHHAVLKAEHASLLRKQDAPEAQTEVQGTDPSSAETAQEVAADVGKAVKESKTGATTDADKTGEKETAKALTPPSASSAAAEETDLANKLADLTVASKSKGASG
ncbi:Sir2 histone deacetylase Hst2 [Tilletia horrida]|uniref:protein acetyllysine N-acetyltransferase n=1 Tax=Tilletia horrida TaxID=155126 RepID=A0AAN6GBU4_9BASI|nr:Sir2 histone deacetylase Hst2 [Tilletia horrida]